MKIKVCFADEEGVFFKVPSSRVKEGYQYVSWDRDNGWFCTCEHYYFRKSFCKHMRLAKEFLDELNRSVKSCDVAYK